MTFQISYYVFSEDIEYCRFNLTLDNAIQYYLKLHMQEKYKALGIHLEPTSSVDVLIKHNGHNDKISDDYLKSPNTKEHPKVLELISLLKDKYSL